MRGKSLDGSFWHLVGTECLEHFFTLESQANVDKRVARAQHARRDDARIVVAEHRHLLRAQPPVQVAPALDVGKHLATHDGTAQS